MYGHFHTNVLMKNMPKPCVNTMSKYPFVWNAVYRSQLDLIDDAFKCMRCINSIHSFSHSLSVFVRVIEYLGVCVPVSVSNSFSSCLKCRTISGSPFLCLMCQCDDNLFGSPIYCSYILRMKEYERERRLMVRRERIAKKKAAEVLAA